MLISIISAVSDNNVIGKTNSLPWYLPADLKHFKDVTMGHIIIMGQKTHESIGRALPGRTNIVLTFDNDFKAEGCIITTSIEEALRVASAKNEDEVFIIGGASVYKQFMEIADKLYITRIHYKFDGDVYFPKIDEKKWKIVSIDKHKKDSKNAYDYTFKVYQKNTKGGRV